MTKLSSSSKYLLFAIIGLVLVAIMLGGYKLLSNSPSPQQPTSNQTSNWKTYTSKYGFSFKYPLEWFITQDNQNPLVIGANYSPDSKEIIDLLTITTDKNHFTDLTSLRKCSEYTNLKVDELPPKCISNPEVYPKQTQPILPIKLSGVDAISFYTIGGVDNNHHIVQTTVSPYIELDMFISGGNLDNRFNQILSTFKFNE